MKIHLYALLLLSVLAISCKRNSDDNSTSVIGKWNVTSYVAKLTTPNNQVFNETTPAVKGDYVDFRSDGNVYSETWYECEFDEAGITISTDYKSTDTSPYHVANNQLVGPTFAFAAVMDIKTLTANQMTLYSKINIPGIGVIENTTHLSK